MKRSLILIFLLVALFFTNSISAQSGGRKKERKAKPRGNLILKRSKSRGNADKFARGNSGRRGKLARLFTKEKPAWTYKKSGTKASQNRANRYLFKRHRSEGVVDNADTQNRQNKKRSRNRVRGNKTFSKKKY